MIETWLPAALACDRSEQAAALTYETAFRAALGVPAVTSGPSAMEQPERPLDLIAAAVEVGGGKVETLLVQHDQRVVEKADDARQLLRVFLAHRTSSRPSAGDPAAWR